MNNSLRWLKKFILRLTEPYNKKNYTYQIYVYSESRCFDLSKYSTHERWISFGLDDGLIFDLKYVRRPNKRTVTTELHNEIILCSTLSIQVILH